MRRLLSRCPLRAQGVCSLCRQGGSLHAKRWEVSHSSPVCILPFLHRPPPSQPVWVDEKYVSQEVVEDFEAGLEYAQAEAVLGCRQQGTMRKYLVR